MSTIKTRNNANDPKYIFLKKLVTLWPFLLAKKYRFKNTFSWHCPFNAGEYRVLGSAALVQSIFQSAARWRAIKCRKTSTNNVLPSLICSECLIINASMVRPWLHTHIFLLSYCNVRKLKSDEIWAHVLSPEQRCWRNLLSESALSRIHIRS